MTREHAESMIQEAQRELNRTRSEMASSAAACLSDARKLFEAGDYRYAHARALDSLRYSAGLHHPAFG